MPIVNSNAQQQEQQQRSSNEFVRGKHTSEERNALVVTKRWRRLTEISTHKRREEMLKKLQARKQERTMGRSETGMSRTRRYPVIGEPVRGRPLGGGERSNKRIPNTMMGVSTLTSNMQFSIEEYQTIRNAIDESLLGRAFGGLKGANNTFPCYPGHNNRPVSGADLRGIIYIRIPKSSSSTLAGINLRIASRRDKNLCGTAWYHKSGNRFDISNRDKAKSLLWTFIRQPTKRTISAFFYFEVSRKNIPQTNARFLQYVGTSHGNDYQLKFVHGDLLVPDNKNSRVVLQYAKDRVQQVLDDYDFIGLTERFDESLVAMQLLFDLDVEDIMYISSNVGGGYDNKLKDQTTRKEKCFKMQSSFVSPEMKTYFDSDKWYAWNTGDFLLYNAANRSLDLTIDQTIGRDVFNVHLEKFQKLKKIGNDKCAMTVLPPCSSNGTKQSKISSRNCYIDDMGCGFDCLDTVTASEYL